MKLRSVVKNQRQEVAVTLPHRQVTEFSEGNPTQRAVVVALRGLADEVVDEKDQPEPVAAVRTKSRPGDAAAQPQGGRIDSGLLAEFSPQAGDGVLTGFQLAAKAVPFAAVVVAGALAVHQQHPIVADDVSEGADDGPKHR